MGVYQILISADKEIKMENRLYSKQQNNNLPYTAKAIILLDTIIIIYNKSNHIIESIITTYIDNKYVFRKIN